MNYIAEVKGTSHCAWKIKIFYISCKILADI